MNKTGAIFTIFLAFVLAIGLVFIDNAGDVYYEAQDVSITPKNTFEDLFGNKQK